MASLSRWVLVLALLAFGCTASRSAFDAGAGGQEDDERECHNGRDDDGDGAIDCGDPSCFALASCTGADGGPARDGGFSGCVGTPYEAEEAFQPIDIIWVVDTSGSMSDEAERVQENMQRFADAMEGVGLDWRVVMISTRDFVNVPASLADDPRYLHVERSVNSNEPLQALLDSFPDYGAVLRRRALTHFVAVTDDDSDLPWESFRDSMRTLLMRNFVFHAIASEQAPTSLSNPDGACETASTFPPEGAASPGIEYYELAAATGGRTFSICTPSEEWVALFDTLTTAIAVPVVIPCEYGIPDPPDGTELDFGRVNVRYTSGGGAATVYPFVGLDDGRADCTSGGWYYDDISAPGAIVLCPSTCEVIQGDAEGRVDVELGCTTFII